MMSDFSHSLYQDFPEYHDLINRLKLEDGEFARVASEYHKLDHSVRGLEMRDVPTTDQHFMDLKMRRAQLKDELYQMLQGNSG
jgi:uncharacterized protein YdcH (DUF465 family)